MRRVLVVLIVLLSFASLGHAQDEADSHQLNHGQSVSGVIDAQHLTQTYVFQNDPSGGSGFSYSNTGAIPLDFAVYDTEGSVLSQTGSIAPGDQGGTGWSDVGPGTFYLVVLPTQGISGGQGAFTIGLLPLSTPDPFGAGINLQFVLTWQAGARLSLESRNNYGESVHWHNTSTDDGGQFSGDTDPIDCKTFTPHDQTQTVQWQAATAGTYEILVHYIDGCVNAVPFTLSTRLEGQDYPMLSGTSQPNKTFVGGFVINEDHSGALNALSGMVSDQPSLTIPTADLVANAAPLPASGTLKDQITSDQPYRSYYFDSSIGQTISATASRASYNLDTVLALIDGNGNLIAINDDADQGTTDSVLDKVRLPRTERYYLVVTRYAQKFGATVGAFNLTVKGLGS